MVASRLLDINPDVQLTVLQVRLALVEAWGAVAEHKLGFAAKHTAMQPGFKGYTPLIQSIRHPPQQQQTHMIV